MDLLKINNLKTYFEISSGLVKAVDGVNFTLNYGESLGLVGESGCGKTTTALSICKLLPKEGSVRGGEILFEGRDFVKLSDSEIKKIRWNEISMIFQGAMNALNPVLKVGDQISEAIVFHKKVSQKQANNRTRELFELVELERYRMCDNNRYSYQGKKTA